MNEGEGHFLYTHLLHPDAYGQLLSSPRLMQLPELTPIWDLKRLRRQHKRPYPDLEITQGSTVAKP